MTPAQDMRLVNLSAILLSVAMVLAPHALHLPNWIPVLVVAVLLTRFFFGFRRRKLPGKWLLIAIALACTAGIAMSYRTLYGRDVGVALLSVMLALKVMEMTSRRDTMVVVLLAYFLVITNFFYSQTIPTAMYMLLVVWAITATMIGLQHQAQAPRLAPVAGQAALIIAQGVPVMLALFLLFPRVQGPLWGLPQINYSAKSGLSDSMAPGDVSFLSLSDEVAFRVLFETQPEKPSQLYWRGPVLWSYDGRTWRAGGNPGATAPRTFDSLGAPLRYTVTMEPHDRHWMFAIDLPMLVPPGAYLNADFQLLSPRVVRERMRYDMQSSPRYRLGTGETQRALDAARRLPPAASPRARALIAQWRTEGASDRDVVTRALNMFREQPFTYTLEPPVLDGDPVDQFLFETRSGFCEHYASSFTFLMRAAGIPARVVTGYLGGEANPVDGYVIVRQSDAHAWSEVWLPGDGWIRVDPTAAVSPLRIERGLAAAMPAIEGPLLTLSGSDWMKQARFALDAVTNTWNQWVLGYNPDRQARFMAQMGFAKVTWQNLVIVLSAVSGAIILALSLMLLLRLNTQRPDPVQRAYLAYCGALARRGAPRLPSEGPRDFEARVSTRFPELRETVRRISDLYVSLRYAGDDDEEKLKALRASVRALSRT